MGLVHVGDIEVDSGPISVAADPRRSDTAPERPRRRLTRRRAAFLAVLVLGLTLRLWGWPHLPDGLNQDEVSAGYEAWSLLLTGADRRGAPWPAYFLSWGSGQNVLYSYLTIPFLAVLGPVPSALRAVALLAGIGSVLLSYRVAEDARRGAGIWAMLIVAVSPWQYMAAHWALESNLLPFVVLLSLFVLGRALRTTRPAVIVPALVPFSLALYAYAVFAIPFLILPVLGILRYHAVLRRHPVAWSASAVLGALVALPFALFYLKAYVVPAPLAIERYLPFSLPDLTSSRLDQIAEQSESDAPPLLGNLGFVVNGFPDGQPWNAVPGFAPLSAVVVALGFAEVCLVVARSVRRRSLEELTLVDLLVISSVVLLLVFPVNLNQANVLAIGLVLAAGKAIARLIPALRRSTGGIAAVVLLCGTIVVPGLLAFVAYVGPDYAETTESNFTPGAQDGIRRAAQLSPGETLWVSPVLNLNYVQTLWYLRIPPQEFRAGGTAPDRTDFGRYEFQGGDLAGLDHFSFVVKSVEPNPCPQPIAVVDRGGIRTGYCESGY